MDGVPVGCLRVPRRHMAVTTSALKEAGFGGNFGWLRVRGIRPCARLAGTYEVHLSVAGAIAMKEMRDDVPAAVRALLASGDVEWVLGARFGNDSGKPKISGAKRLVQSELAADVQQPASRPSTFRFAELFAGVGGFRLALERLGGECVFASEIDAHAAATYAANFGAPPHAGDITEVCHPDRVIGLCHAR
jgi:hypothetical protein